MMILSVVLSSVLTLVELNCENLFDCRHDSLKEDLDFLPESGRHWTPTRYWRKINRIAKEIVACGEDTLEYNLPDLVALCEVENDSVMNDLAHRSILRNLHYDYLMTNSPDIRGVDVALLYHTFTFMPISHQSFRVDPLKGMRPTRDILYVKGQVLSGDTLHIFVIHAPSKFGGEKKTRPYRLAVAKRVSMAIDSIRNVSEAPKIIVVGDFNDYSDGPSLQYFEERHLQNVSAKAKGRWKANGTYCFRGHWESIDHVLVSLPMMPHWRTSYIKDAPFLLEEDLTYGGYKPRRTYNGYHYQPDGFSDHLPLVVKFSF